MYHYVRDLARTRYPELKALDVRLFREQLAYVRRHYTVITAQELIAAVAEGPRGGAWALPRNAMLLTFDDGYADHFEHVFPALAEHRLQGSFFAPVRAIQERTLLDVHKIHFVLASGVGARVLVDEIIRAINVRRTEFSLEPGAVLYERLAHASRFDPPEVMFVKRTLQSALPPALRMEVVRELFRRYVSTDEAAFADELYLDAEQARVMASEGMYFGGHGDSHARLGQLPPEAQADEIERSLRFVTELGADPRGWVIAYPYGDWSEGLLRLLRARGCAVGLTTQPAIATDEMDPLLVPRLAPNDLPTRADAAPAAWTVSVA